MGVIININDAMEKTCLCEKITFGSLDFVADRLGTCTYRTLNPSCRGGAPFHLDVPRRARGCCGRWCTRVGPSHGPPCSVLLHQLWSQTHPWLGHQLPTGIHRLGSQCRIEGSNMQYRCRFLDRPEECRGCIPAYASIAYARVSRRSHHWLQRRRYRTPWWWWESQWCCRFITMASLEDYDDINMDFEIQNMTTTEIDAYDFVCYLRWWRHS